MLLPKVSIVVSWNEIKLNMGKPPGYSIQIPIGISFLIKGVSRYDQLFYPPGGENLKKSRERFFPLWMVRR